MGARGPDGLVTAPLLLRASAWLIDLAVLIVLGFSVASAMGDVLLERRETYAAVVILIAAYNVGFLAARSATPGKTAMGLYVGDLRGRRLRPDTAILRYLTQLVGGLVILGTVASVALVLFDPQRRTVHDRVAQTRVLWGKPVA